MSKISAYAALTGPNIASDDVIAIVDTSATATKKMAADQILQGALLAASSKILDTNGNELTSFTTNGSAVNEFTIANAATGNRPVLSATGGDTNVGIGLTPKGTGGVVLTGNSTQLLTAGANGTTNPVLQVDANTASVATGLKLTGAAAAAGVDLTVLSSGTNENLTINAKGSGTITLNSTGTGNVKLGVATLSFPTAGILADTNGNELIKFPSTVASAVNEFTVTNSATGNPVLIAATGGDTNVGVKINAKGSGTITLNDVGTGNVVTSVPIVITSASANAFAVGRQGTTNPGFLVDASTATNVTGIKITPAAAAAGVDASVISSGTNENLTINAKGSGTIDLNPTGTGNVTTARGVLSRSATAGIGYATGAGGTVTQVTSRTTGVTLNTIVGEITLVSAAGSATWQSFTVTNSAVAATDRVIVNQKSGTDLYMTHVTALGAGSFRISFATTGGTTTEQPVFGFTVIKGVAS